MNECIYCINKEVCSDCDTAWHDTGMRANLTVKQWQSIGIAN